MLFNPLMEASISRVQLFLEMCDKKHALHLCTTTESSPRVLKLDFYLSLITSYKVSSAG